MSNFWILTHTGHRFDILDIETNEIRVADIAWSLSNICRFGGHVSAFYSVAEHSLAVALRVPPRDQLQALLHDATEAYLGDVVTPLKRLLPDYQDLENRLWAHIAKELGVDPVLAPSVLQADHDMCQLEAWCLLRDLPISGKPAGHLAEFRNPRNAECLPKCLSPEAASQRFMNRYYELIGHAR